MAYIVVNSTKSTQMSVPVICHCFAPFAKCIMKWKSEAVNWGRWAFRMKIIYNKKWNRKVPVKKMCA